MNEIERLRSTVERTFSDAKTRIDEPQGKDGEWYLNAWCRGLALVIQWNEGGRFGVSTPTGDCTAKEQMRAIPVSTSCGKGFARSLNVVRVHKCPRPGSHL